MRCMLLLSFLFVSLILIEACAPGDMIFRWVLTAGCFLVCIIAAYLLWLHEDREREKLHVMIAHAADGSSCRQELRLGTWASDLFRFVNAQFVRASQEIEKMRKKQKELEAEIAEHYRFKSELENEMSRNAEKLRALSVLGKEAAGGLSRELHRMALVVAEVNHVVETQKHGLHETAEAVASALNHVDQGPSGPALAPGNAGSSPDPADNGQREVREAAYMVRAAMEPVNTIMESSINMTRSFTARLVQVSDTVEELHNITDALGNGNLEVDCGQRLTEWDPDMETGIKLIDSQHKMFCAYINALHRAAVEQADDEEVLEIVGSLKAYASAHFGTEEQYFSRSAHPDTEEHKRTHQSFIDTIVLVEQKLRDGAVKLDDELLGFIKDWLFNHIAIMDRQSADYILESAGQAA